MFYDDAVDYENDKHYAGNHNKDLRNLKDITKNHNDLEVQMAVENIQDVKLHSYNENEPTFAVDPNVRTEEENQVNAENKINLSKVHHVRHKKDNFDTN